MLPTMQHELTRMVSPLRSRTCGVLAAGGLAGLSLFIAIDHRPQVSGIAASDLDMLADEGDPEWRTGDYLIDLVEPEDGEGGSEAELAAWVSQLAREADIDVEPAGFYSEGEHLFRVRASGDVWERLQQRLIDDPLVEGVEAEVEFAIMPAAMAAETDDGAALEGPTPAKPPRLEPDDPMFHYQWHMEQVRAPEAWASSTRGEGAIVAVIDTGVAWRTEAGIRQLPDLKQTKFTSGESFVAGAPSGLDDHAHGSHVAGTIAQSTDNGIGVTGVAYASTIMPLKVLAKDGRGSVPGIANAIRYAADHGAHVINMSLGGPLPSKVLAKAIEYAHQKGVTVVCAAGNESRSRVGYPAANAHSIAVSATNFERSLSFYSNWGAQIDVAAPGGDTRADKNGDGKPDGVLQNTIAIQRPEISEYLWFQGTSMAAPHAAGVAALIVGEGVTNPDEVERILKKSARHPEGVEWDKFFGAGIVDAEAAVAMAQKPYARERAGLLGFLSFGLLAGVGVSGNRARSQRWRSALGIGAGAALSAGLGVMPLAYALGNLTAGVAGMSSALWMSAAVPLLLTLLFLGKRAFRPVLLGVSLGYAALLLHGAIVLPTLLSGLPGGPGVDRLWLALQAVLSLGLAWRLRQLPDTQSYVGRA